MPSSPNCFTHSSPSKWMVTPVGLAEKRGQDTQDGRLSRQNSCSSHVNPSKPKPNRETETRPTDFPHPQQYPIKPCHDSPRQTFPHPQRCPIKTLAALPWARLPRLNALSRVAEPRPRVLAIKLILWTTFAFAVLISLATRKNLTDMSKADMQSSLFSG